MAEVASPIVRELSYDERATWGKCPVCNAEHGHRCDGTRGIPLGFTASGGLPENGVHLGRLQKAPRRVRMVPEA